jgi:glycosyltransferase involved in cell wall biosynthesis
MNGISVIVCCYNSVSCLPETLKYLALQQIPSNIHCEVIIVNNASTDDTVGVTINEWEKLKCTEVEFHIINQLVSGLSNARKKGIEVAKYEYILFCDGRRPLNKF